MHKLAVDELLLGSVVHSLTQALPNLTTSVRYPWSRA